MSEPTVFEARLRTALRRHVAAGPTVFDALGFARSVAGAEPRRHGLARALAWPRLATDSRPWSRPAVPRLAWLLLPAILLVAMVVGALLAGSHRPALGFTCPAGTNPDIAGPIGQTRPPLVRAAPMAFDHEAGRVVLVAQASGAVSPETWTFDVCTNTWIQMHPRQEPNGVSQLAYDADSDLTVTADFFGDRRVWAYDLEANTWTSKGVVPMVLTRQPRLVYDSATGLVLMQAATSEIESEPSELWTYDVDSDTWARVAQAGAAVQARAHQGVLAYDPSVDGLVSYEPLAGTQLFDFRTGAWSWSGSARVAPDVDFMWGPSGGEIAYEGGTQRTVVFSRGRVIAYDARADRWEILADGADPAHTWDFNGPTSLSEPWIVSDPVNHRLIVYGGRYLTSPPDAYAPSWAQADAVLAFDPVKREWKVLLGATTVQPAFWPDPGGD